MICPHRVVGPPDQDRNQPHHYWPFATSNFYSWRTENAPFSENPKELISLFETTLFIHQHTWDDCQQLLQVLFTWQVWLQVFASICRYFLMVDRGFPHQIGNGTGGSKEVT